MGESPASRWALNNYWPFGYVVEEQSCVMCGHEWVLVAPTGTLGLECPACGFCDPSVEHLGRGDGVWIVGPDAYENLRWYELEDDEPNLEDVPRWWALIVLIIALVRELRRS